MKSYDKILKRYEGFAKIYEGLKTVRPGRLYKCTQVPAEIQKESGKWPESKWLWHIGILSQCTQSAVTFRTVASRYEELPNVDRFAIPLWRLPQYKIEQLKMSDLPAYISSHKTVLYEKLLLKKIRIKED